MTTRFATLAFVALFALASGCRKSGQPASPTNTAPSSIPAGADSGAVTQPGGSSQVSNSDANAIRAAIEDRLRGNHGLNLNAMEMTVDSININGDQAQAHASFHVKNGGATGMTMQYVLQRSGNGWVVTNAQPADGNTQLPPPGAAHPGVNSTQSAPSVPDVESFLKNHPTQKPN
jgi:hypothetical protein